MVCLGMTCALGSTKMFSTGTFEAYFSYHKGILRDACLYMGGYLAPPAPRFLFLTTLTVRRILFKFGRCMQ